VVQGDRAVNGAAQVVWPRPERFEEFGRRYRAELNEPERAGALAHLRELAAGRGLTLLTATRQPEISEAAVLARLLRD
jgi:uncharacterized protein YeaO (DUF488 family)